MEGLILPDPGQPDYCARCASPLERREKGGRLRPVCPVCGWVYYAKTAFGAAVAVEQDGQILLVQRGHEPYQGWWMLPAGFVEYGEFAEDTAVREAAEETGLTVALTGLLGLYYGMDDPRNPSHLAVYTAQAIGGTLQPGDDASDVRYFAPEALPEKVAFEGQRRVLLDWVADLAQRRGVRPARPRFLAFSAAGPAAPVLVYVVIENPRGSEIRLEYDPQRWLFALTGQRLPSPAPYHYGWIPHTLSVDGEELDVWLVDQAVMAPGAAVVARPVGVQFRADGDHAIIVLPASGPHGRPEITELAQLPEVQRLVAEHGGAEATTGWGDAVTARRLISEAQERWLAKHQA